MDILQYCSPVDEVIVANNGSEDEAVAAGIKWWKSTGKLPIKEFRAEENIGFLKICNMSVEKAKGDIVILISNDVSVREDMVAQIENLLSVPGKRIIGGVLYQHDTGWNTFGSTTFPYLEGWLLSFHKRSWDDIGGFDERYSPNDFEDMDFSTAAIDKGYLLVPLIHASNPRIWHTSGQTLGYGPEREKLTKKNQAKFKKKWIDKK